MVNTYNVYHNGKMVASNVRAVQAAEIADVSSRAVWKYARVKYTTMDGYSFCENGNNMEPYWFPKFKKEWNEARFKLLKLKGEEGDRT